MTLVLTENPDRLGSVTVAGDQGELSIDLLVYDHDKQDVLGLTDESQSKGMTRIPSSKMFESKNVALLKRSNTSLTEVGCRVISPTKLRPSIGNR